ncbi:MAG: thioredoxin-disulfide reductase [Clostridia bacterium]|nr:thioredoxin-disulfide reductase [Clostridia bacterium]
MAAKHIDENQLHELIQSGKTVLADFWAPWCGDCRRIEKPYDEIADELSGRVIVVKLNVDEIDGIRQREDIRRIPTIRLYENGASLGQIVEPPAKADIEEFLKDLLPEKEKTQDDHVYDMAIIGGGPGGYTAALYAARAGMDIVLLERLSAGGQMALTHQIDNYPGFTDGIGGIELGEQMKNQAERFGAKTVSADVKKLDLAAKNKIIETSEGTFQSKTVVIATGANPRALGLPAEEDLIGLGVHYCAACDGMFYKGKTVAVVGGGNSAAADALLLSRVAEKVIVIHRRDALRATKIYHEPLMQAKNVEFLWDSRVEKLLHDKKLTGLSVKNIKTGEETDLSVDGVFISIGRKPATELVKDQLILDENGYIASGETTETNLPGVYAVGDVRAKLLRQVVTAVSDGAVASHMAETYLINA